MNTLLKELKNEANKTYTENGAAALKSTGNAVYDLFATGAAYRSRSDSDVLYLFTQAWNENPELALKCLFYLRDIRGGQGERRFFRVCMRWLAVNAPDVVRKNMKNIIEYGRFDDLYCLVDTPVEKDVFKFIKKLIAESIRAFEKEEKQCQQKLI